MLSATPLSVVLTSAMLAAVAGCSAMHVHRLSRSADRLEQDTDALASDASAASSGYMTSDYARDARDLADLSEEFRHAIIERRTDQRDMQKTFARVSSSYHALRREVDRSGNEEARADLRPVTQDYLHLEDQMQAYPANGRYAERDHSERY